VTVKNCGNNSYIYGIPYSKHSAYNELVDCLLCLKPGKIHSTVDVQNGDAQVNMLVKSCRELINEELAEGISEIESRSRRGDDYDYEIIGGGVVIPLEEKMMLARRILVMRKMIPATNSNTIQELMICCKIYIITAFVFF